MAETRITVYTGLSNPITGEWQLFTDGDALEFRELLTNVLRDPNGVLCIRTSDGTEAIVRTQFIIRVQLESRHPGEPYTEPTMPESTETAASEAPARKRGPGRPRGSRNKPTTSAADEQAGDATNGQAPAPAPAPAGSPVGQPVIPPQPHGM